MTAFAPWCRWYSASVVEVLLLVELSLSQYVDMIQNPSYCHSVSLKVLGPVLFIMYTKPLSDLIAKHPVKHQSFADDTQLNTSFDSCNIDSAVEIIQHCTKY